MLKKYKVVLVVLLVSFAAGLFLSTNAAQASVACHWYKKYKKEVHNEKDKARYFKMKWLQDNNPVVYSFYKTLCEAHKFDSNQAFAKLSQKNQEMCRQYLTHEKYESYIYYRDHCDRNDDGNTVVSPPAPEDGGGEGEIIFFD